MPYEATNAGYKLQIMGKCIENFLKEVGPDRDFAVKTENNNGYNVIVVETI